MSNPIPRVSESALIAKSALKSFKEMISHMDKVRKLSGLELIEEVEEINPFKVLSYNHVLIDELVRRYEKAASVVRPEEEFPEPTEADLAEIDAIEKEMEAEKDRVLYWVIRFEDGRFYPQPLNDLPSLPAALRFSIHTEAEMAADAIPGSTLVEVTP
ncbi:MAG: hypothetical protein WC763_07570 [Candidatus Paceibacterota bacterium]|jgi:hypothetical protein